MKLPPVKSTSETDRFIPEIALIMGEDPALAADQLFRLQIATTEAAAESLAQYFDLCRLGMSWWTQNLAFLGQPWRSPAELRAENTALQQSRGA